MFYKAGGEEMQTQLCGYSLEQAVVLRAKIDWQYCIATSCLDIGVL